MCKEHPFCLGCEIIPNKSTPLIEPPICPTHNVYMKMRTAYQTTEQKFCGTWYDCIYPQCCNSTLIPSQELMAFHKSMCLKKESCKNSERSKLS